MHMIDESITENIKNLNRYRLKITANGVFWKTDINSYLNMGRNT